MEAKERENYLEARRWKQGNIDKHGWVTEELMMQFAEYKTQQLNNK